MNVGVVRRLIMIMLVLLVLLFLLVILVIFSPAWVHEALFDGQCRLTFCSNKPRPGMLCRFQISGASAADDECHRCQQPHERGAARNHESSAVDKSGKLVEMC